MGRRQPHASNKIAIGVILGGLSFLLMVIPTSGHAGDDYRMAAWWIVGSYLLLGLGDILLETSGMSATTKLAPKAFSSQTMSLWFLSLALANGIQAQIVKLYDDVSNPAYFGVNGAHRGRPRPRRDRRSRLAAPHHAPRPLTTDAPVH